MACALAGGAALAGLAGGVALGRRTSAGSASKTAAGLAEATKNAGRFTENLGALAGEMRKARETIDGDTAAKHRSPIEVVLQALTARR